MTIAYLNGEWIPPESLSVDVNDVGFLMGATASERLRTFEGRVFRLDEHLQRLARSLSWMRLDGPGFTMALRPVIEEIVVRNHPLLETGDDLSIVVFVTPAPTVCVYTMPIPFSRHAELYETGQALITSRWRQVPDTCWPPALKCRSRIHYFLADADAQAADPASRALLLDQRGFVAEASTANVLLVRDETILSPRLDYILPGVSLAVVAELAARVGLAMQYHDCPPEWLRESDEILLCSTTPFLLPVSSIDGQQVDPTGIAGPAFKRLVAAFSEAVGVDIVAQAREFAARDTGR